MRTTRKRHTHKWKTVYSYGAWGHDAVCVLCGKFSTFIAKD